MSPDIPIYQIKITLQDISPPIWRRVLVPGDASLRELHDIIQVVMGWWNCHLHEFAVGSRHYGEPDPDYDSYMEMLDDKKVQLQDIVSAGSRRFHYEYDFGDGWEHDLHVEKTLAAQEGARYPVCIDGRRACPPEDVGGTGGYEEFLDAISDPEHEGHDSYLTWIGGEFDPEEFDLEVVNAALDELSRWLPSEFRSLLA